MTEFMQKLKDRLQLAEEFNFQLISVPVEDLKKLINLVQNTQDGIKLPAE
jgi:hypothetical protein